jgi:reprolysin-like metallo-peptidase family M12B/IPT/TIG domain-containing protein
MLTLRRICGSFAVAVMLCSAAPAAAEDRLFGDLSTESLQSLPSRGSWDAPLPGRFRALEVDIDALESLLFRAPVEGSVAAATLVIALPYPDGMDRRFLVEESPILEPGLAASFPEIRTFVAKGIDDPTATARLSLTSLGFHAMVLSTSGTVFIDPYRRWDSRYALSYFKQDAVKPAGKSFRCDAMNESPKENFVEQAFPPDPFSGYQLRTYHLALASTGEYSAAVCAPNPVSVSCALNTMAVTLNRANAIFEREVSIHMNLVNHNDLIVYTNGGTDPYDNFNNSAILRQNQANLDLVIGTANYDIGHVFSNNDGSGLAWLQAACTAANKAQGVSSLASRGDHLDTVAHEMGHQFGASHSFNATTGNCNGNRMPAAAYEPGSGSTIMSYAGRCGAGNDFQYYSDDTFHPKSYDEIVAFTTRAAGNDCPAITFTHNTPPGVYAGPAFTIPKQTPFTLTGRAFDQDGDTLTYMWEEFDLGTAAPPHNDVDAERPIFRSFVPLTEPSRTFPRLPQILSHVETLGESMSTRNRTMTFRLTVRDNRTGGGGVNWAATTVTVNAAAGPFAVTQPNSPLSWPGGSSQTVTWNVAGTTAAPISCANVAIHLSTDGGNTFPTALATSTANDGTERVTIPNTPTTRARVRVSCVGNIFFDISDVNFTILLAPTLTSIEPTLGAGAGGTGVTLTGTNFVNGATVLFGGVPATSVTFNGATSLTALTPAHSAGAVDVTVTNPNQVSATLRAAFTYLEPPLFQLPPTVNTSASPSAITIASTTYVFYKGAGTDPGIYVTSSRQSIYPGSWTLKRLPSAIGTSAAPSVAQLGGNIYVAYKGAGSDTNIYVARSITETATWTMTKFPVGVNTSTGPKAFFYGNRFYVFYKSSGDDQRMFVERLADDAIWTPAEVGAGLADFKTSGNNTVPGIADLSSSPKFQLPGTVNTSATPSAILVPIFGLDPPSCVFYKGVAGDSRIWMILSSRGEINPATTWTQKPLPSPIGTSDAPSAVVTDRSIYVVYKGAGSDSTIYVARSSDATVTWAITKFPPAVSTSTGPTAFVSERRLYVFYKGLLDERMYVAKLLDDATWTPIP